MAFMPSHAPRAVVNPTANVLSSHSPFAKSKSANFNFKKESTSNVSLNASASSSEESNKQGLASSTFSLVKAIVGSGVLALPG